MLTKSHPLYFPKLKFIKEGQLVHKDNGGESGRPINIYSLDWSKQEKFIEEKHENWKNKYHPTKKLPFIGQLPKEWEAWIKSLVFAIDDYYLREIRFWTQNALMFWSRRNYASADTVVREYCLNPAIEMIDVAFFLIGDCVYDMQTQYFSRSSKKYLTNNVMLYKFWAYQTGRGLLWDRANLDALKWRVKESYTALHNPNDEFITEGKKLLADIEKHQEAFEEAYKELCIDSDIGEKKSN